MLAIITPGQSNAASSFVGINRRPSVVRRLRLLDDTRTVAQGELGVGPAFNGGREARPAPTGNPSRQRGVRGPPLRTGPALYSLSQIRRRRDDALEAHLAKRGGTPPPGRRLIPTSRFYIFRKALCRLRRARCDLSTAQVVVLIYPLGFDPICS
jgi:hypothetical protein